VVFSDQTMANLKAATIRRGAAAIAEAAWPLGRHRCPHPRRDDHDFRRPWLHPASAATAADILQDRARRAWACELQVRGMSIDLADLIRPCDADLIVASDGLNRRSATILAEVFQVDIDVRPNKYVWLGTNQKFDAFTFAFVETEHGWIWAHAYQFEPGASTFIVECSEETWRGLGFDRHGRRTRPAAKASGCSPNYLGGTS
jgi:anthraniloyl-CoA monooxygenase